MRNCLPPLPAFHPWQEDQATVADILPAKVVKEITVKAPHGRMQELATHRFWGSYGARDGLFIRQRGLKSPGIPILIGELGLSSQSLKRPMGRDSCCMATQCRCLKRPQLMMPGT